MGWVYFAVSATAWFLLHGDIKTIAGINAIANFCTLGIIWNFRHQIRASQATGLPEAAFGGGPPGWAVLLNLATVVAGVVFLIIGLVRR
jgi:hypothetical protein